MSDAQNEEQYPSPTYAWYVVVILFLAFVVSYIDRQIISLLVDLSRKTLASVIPRLALLQGFAFTVFYTFAGIPLGRLADKKNRKGDYRCWHVSWSIMTFACGLTRNFTQLFIARIGVGIGEASLSPASNSSSATTFRRTSAANPLPLLHGSLRRCRHVIYFGGLVIGMVTSAGDSIVPPMLGRTPVPGK